MNDGQFYDELETRDPAQREGVLFAALPAYLEAARRTAPALTARLEGFSSAEIDSRAALARLPLLRKSELVTLQRGDPPFGGLAAIRPGEAAHVYASPGPIYELEAGRPDFAG